MSNEEEKRCPLCAEEMDWTDQQLKPCKCGYEVWYLLHGHKDVTFGVITCVIVLPTFFKTTHAIVQTVNMENLD